MADFEVAHVHERGNNMIIIPLPEEFGLKSRDEQDAFHDALQACAKSARLDGTVVLVWDEGAGRMAFRAPPSWHALFLTLDLARIGSSINKTLTCG